MKKLPPASSTPSPAGATPGEASSPVSSAPQPATLPPSSLPSARPRQNEVEAGNPQPPTIPDHELLKRIGGGSYGEVWLARSVMGTYRAVKIVHRHTFDHDRPFEREFAGIQKFEPISRSR